ncbi:MAG: FecR domain-containing protein [Adhaeribacter sp.]
MDNNQPHFEKAELILRHLRGELTQQEEEAFGQWLQADEQNRRFLEKIVNQQQLEEELTFFSSVDTPAAWRRVASQTIEKEEAGSRWQKAGVWKYAAVIALLLAAVLVIYQTKLKGKDPRPGIAAAAPGQQGEKILPGGNKARLILGDGTVVMLEEVPDGTVREANGLRVFKQEGQVVFNILEDSSSEISYNTISTPVGGQYQVVLPDGSKVWLNSASSLRFPSAFVKHERVVELTGEGYFEIAKNRAKPFRVLANTATVEVLGTHFNLMAYSNEKYIRTTLLEGAVKVGNGREQKRMVPGQQALIGEEIVLKQVDVKEAVAWKNGLFYFRKLDIATVMRQLERWYGIEVHYSGGQPSKHFTGIISRDTDITKVLEMLTMTGAIQVKTEGRKITVSTN